MIGFLGTGDQSHASASPKLTARHFSGPAASAGILRTQVLSGCILGTEKPDLALDVPDRYRAAHGTAAVPALDCGVGSVRAS